MKLITLNKFLQKMDTNKKRKEKPEADAAKKANDRPMISRMRRKAYEKREADAAKKANVIAFMKASIIAFDAMQWGMRAQWRARRAEEYSFFLITTKQPLRRRCLISVDLAVHGTTVTFSDVIRGRGHRYSMPVASTDGVPLFAKLPRVVEQLIYKFVF